MNGIPDPGLDSLPGFRELNDRDRRAVARSATFRTYRTRRVICYQSEAAEEAYLIISGAVERLMYRADESTLQLGDAVPGDWVGLSELLLRAAYLSDAVCMEETTVLAFSPAAMDSIRSFPPVERIVVLQLARENFRLHTQLELNRATPRLVRYILTHSSSTAEGRTALEITQEELARNTGLARETVNKHLRELQSSGVIALRRGAIDVLERAALEEWSEL